MSPRPGDREGSSLHVVEEVKARIEVEGSGRNNLLLSMVAAIVVEVEAVAREGKPRTSSKLRLVVFFQRQYVRELMISGSVDCIVTRESVLEVESFRVQEEQQQQVDEGVGSTRSGGCRGTLVVGVARMMHAYKTAQALSNDGG